MQDILVAKLQNYLISNHPDLLVRLKQDVNIYIKEKVIVIEKLLKELLAEGKPFYMIEEICMEVLTRDFGPSKFNYILALLEEEFETEFGELKQSGILNYEVINMIQVCKPLFEEFPLANETEDDRHLRYAITGEIQAYLKSN